MLDSSSIPEFPEAFVEATARDEGKSATTAGKYFISFSHVNISFDGRLVLEDVSFYVERGQTLCILGRSGVGKSVALRLLMGFLKPDSGSIRVEDEEITGLDEEGMNAIRKRVTMVDRKSTRLNSSHGNI